MNAFNKVLDKTILKIQRLDSAVDYELLSPYSIILTFTDLSEKLIISSANDDSSLDIGLISDKEIREKYELKFSRYILNDLKPDDKLNVFMGDTIRSIRIAQFIVPEITGPDFVIEQGKYAGIELKSSEHKLLYQSDHGSCLNIDNDEFELPNPESWQWK